jgi:deferrochelatase/peroxidase EfeB
LTFHKDTCQQAKRFLSGLAHSQKLTTASEQRKQKRRHRQGLSELFSAVYLSARGYEFLGYPQGRFSKEFWKGMRAAKLGDPPAQEWEPHYQRDIHAMLLYAHDHPGKLDRPTQQVLAELDGIAKVALERGQTINEPKVVEHFGYRDGLSQPLFTRAMSRITPRTGIPVPARTWF